MSGEFIIERSRRRSLSLSVTKDLKVKVKAPYFMTKGRIEVFVSENREWISRRIEIQKRINDLKSEYSAKTSEGRARRRAALEELTSRTRYWAEKMGVAPSGIRLSSAEKRFGSCNSAGEISYSVILMYFSPEDRDAVIVHELAHLKEMNHGKSFYKCVTDVMPDYRERMKNLKFKGNSLP